ncbi:hypothetical protein FB471_3800 [Amycolatopsis cihanbeyliensis]|uniref:CorA-like Mg2+ transporter protein n=2 Tax=Amycolatopsis cihanbeyliensis TaxID=1128664 RepID=A0A542DLN9_AMYCI|nr:hypothetical protein FB471_3800 [Amycolatopsis cihanbeyliensis]
MVARRPRTRVLLLYSLANRLPNGVGHGPHTRSLHTLFAFGRFTAHLEAAGSVLPRVLDEWELDGSALELPPEPPRADAVTVIVVVSPRGDPTLLLDLGLPEAADAETVTELLAATCFRRGELTLRQRPILEWVAGRIGYAGELEFGRDLHQLVFPGGRLLDRIRTEQLAVRDGVSPTLAQVIYRGAGLADAGIRRPAGLNDHVRSVVAHGRGVSVAAAWEPRAAPWNAELENAFAVVAMTQVSALGVVQRTRRNAFRALTDNEHALPTSTAEARTLISDLSTELNEMQLDLSFGVEAYLDSLLIPESALEHYQTSLRGAIGLTDGLANTSRMLDRLQSVIQARLSGLEATVQERVEQRSRALSWVVAVGTLIALPPALLLAFFGLNGTEVDETRSMFDLGRYWPAYLAAWLPFLLLVLVGLVLRRKADRA